MKTIKELNYYNLTLYLILFIFASSLSFADQSADLLWYDWTTLSPNYMTRKLFITKAVGSDNKLGFINLYLLEEGYDRAAKEELIEPVEESDSRGLEIRSEYIAEGREVRLKLTVYDNLTGKAAIEKSFTFSQNYRFEIAIAFESLFRDLRHYIKEYNEQLMGKMTGSSDYLLKLRDRVEVVPIFNDKTTLIVYNPNRESYTIHCRGESYEAIKGIVALIIDVNSVDKLELVYSGQKRPILIGFSPEAKVIEHAIKLPAEMSPPASRYALDIAYTQTTGGYMGGDLTLSLGFKSSRAFKDSLYFKWHFSLKAVHIAEQDIDPVRATNFRIKTGVGYRHLFNINGLLSIGTGVESGFEFYLLKKLYYSIFSYESPDSYFPGFPSFYLSIPLYIELLSFSKVSIFATVEPTFRVVSKVIFYDGYVWRDNFEIDGYEKNYFRLTLERANYSSPYTALDLFINDIPITLGLRVKI